MVCILVLVCIFVPKKIYGTYMKYTGNLSGSGQDLELYELYLKIPDPTGSGPSTRKTDLARIKL